MTPPPRPARPIARIITRLNIGGPSIQAARLTIDLRARGYDTRLFHGSLGEGEGDMRYLLPPDADVRFVPTLRRKLSPIHDLRAFVRLYRELRRLQPVLVHTHMAKAGLVGRCAAAAYNLTRGRSPRARLVHTYHGHVLDGYFDPVRTWVFIALERILARTTDAIVAISPAIRQDLIETYRIGRPWQYHVVPLGFDLAPFAAIDDEARRAARATLGLPAGAPVVTTVGRLTAIKQQGLFLDAFQQVHARHPDAVALVAGDGELRHALEADAAARGIGQAVRFLGWRRDLPAIYGATDVFLLTSRNEGTPVALIEAMASAVPGVSTDVGGVRDVIDSPAVGTRVPDGDAAALAAAVTALLVDPTARRTTGDRARAQVVGRFAIERLVANVAALYDRLITGS
jgi:glycosyltransferase involved in cell wall biosynthesis